MKSFLRTLKFITPYLLPAILGPVFMAIEVVGDLVQPRLMQNIVDVGLVNQDYHYTLVTSGLMIGATVIGLLGGVGSTYFSTIAGVNMGADIRDTLYRKIQKLSFYEIDKISTGSLVTRLTNDIIQVQEITIMMLRILVRVPLIILGSLVMVLLISVKLSLILAVLIPILVLSISVIMNKSFPLFAEVQDRLDRINNVARENLSGVRVVKAYAREPFENKRFLKSNTNFTEMMEKASSVIAFIFPIMILLLNGGIAAALYLGGNLSFSGELSTGELIAFINYLMQLLMSLMMVSMILMRFSRSEVSARRIMEVLDMVPSLTDPAESASCESGRGKLVFDNVSFGYSQSEDDRCALSDISFSIEPGRTTAIIGTTGSGKSTLVNLMARLYDVNHGTITINDVDIRMMNQQQVRAYLGIVPQTAHLFSGTIRENISYGKPAASDEEVLAAAETAQIKDFIDQAPHGLDTLLKQKGVNLSGGQKQRLSIARALLPDPPILVLDESTSALDSKTASKLQQALASRDREKSTLIIGQRIASVMNADTIIVLDNGTIIDNADHKTLLQRCTLYREIVVSQLGEEALNV